VSTTTAQIKQIATIVVPVSDQERALDLYVRKLGLHGAADVPMGSVPLAGGRREGRDDDRDRAVAPR
jgi:catechol 2,3-dioxygenase-like lactoylglutathione lyase family enzyme